MIVKEKENDYEFNAKSLDEKRNKKTELEETNKKLYQSVEDQINIESKDMNMKILKKIVTENLSRLVQK